jgi:ribosomal protein S18 acetylase RimI-like enzyme
MARRLRWLAPERVDDLPDMCACCSFWEGSGAGDPACGESCDRETLLAWIREVRAEWGECGRIAYEGDEVLGFVKYAAPKYFPQVRSMPSGVPDSDAVLIACLHVSATARHAGLGKVLLQAALRDLTSRREKAVEAYAAGGAVDREHTPLMSVEFLLRQGFSVARPHPRYPLMRLELKQLAAWTDNLEAVLEALQLPVRVGERVPASLAAAGGRRTPS